MSEKQFKLSSETVLQYQIMDNDTDLNENEVCDLLNEQQAQINYWKHKANSLLWILGQFDEEKVKKLLKEIDDE